MLVAAGTMLALGLVMARVLKSRPPADAALVSLAPHS
jgi:hypothetical protein